MTEPAEVGYAAFTIESVAATCEAILQNQPVDHAAATRIVDDVVTPLLRSA